LAHLVQFKRMLMQEECRRFFSTTFWNFWHVTRLSNVNRHKVINAQTGPFLAHTV